MIFDSQVIENLIIDIQLETIINFLINRIRASIGDLDGLIELLAKLVLI